MSGRTSVDIYVLEGGKEVGRVGGREGGREEGREEGSELGREGEKEGSRGRGGVICLTFLQTFLAPSCSSKNKPSHVFCKC